MGSKPGRLPQLLALLPPLTDCAACPLAPRPCLPAEAARRVADSLAAVLSSWQAAAGSATTQAELAAALEDTARRVAAAAAASGALGRAGLQPRQLTLEGYVEARRGGDPAAAQPALCACMDPSLAAPPAAAGDWAAAAHARYVAARLALCRFSCAHQRSLTVLLIIELVLCGAWLAAWVLRGSAAPDAQPAAGTAGSSGCGRRPRGEQFLIASAADPQWQAELKQPLLAADHC